MGLNDLPTFLNGYPLSSESLRRIGHAQDYLNERYNRVFAGQPVMRLETPYDGVDYSKRSMFMVHLYRYLHWSLRQDTALAGRSFLMKVNGKRAAVVNESSPLTNTGVIDLNGNDLDGGPFGLTTNRAYEIEWSTVAGTLSGLYGQVYAYNTFECATNNSSLALPTSNPSFGDGNVPQDTQLNAIVTNCNYLLSTNGLIHLPGFRYDKVGIPAPSGSTANLSYVPHYYKYLALRFDVDMGFVANTIDIYVAINGTQVYSDSKVKTSEGGGVIHPFMVYIDISGLGLTTGVPYRVEINASKHAWDDYTDLIVYYVGESPVNTRPEW